MVPPLTAIERLQKGNLRYVAGDSVHDRTNFETRRLELIAGQNPFAVILSCSDSRVPTETIFDQGLGDLFVIRVAGNVAGLVAVGSIEYAVDVLGVQLVVVLGHSGCGAVQATLAEQAQPGGNLSPGLSSIIEAIKPALNSTSRTMDIDEAVHANVKQTLQQIPAQSKTIERLIKADTLHLAGAVYSLASGRVEFM